MRVFVIRPFGTQEGIDFDRVDRELIQAAYPKLAQQGIELFGGTTGLISRQGNIREDMFRMIVASDLVIADVSIHNANVFYELGIRHALRPHHTVLIRCRSEHRYPFDLQTDRYFLYDAADPGQAVDAFVRAVATTLASAGRDSPVFALLPDLAPHGRGQLVKVPDEFREEVERARLANHRGDLRLLAHEASSFEWDREGLRLIGEAQFKLRAYRGARETFESLRRTQPDDVACNLRLGTLYQRLAFSEPAGRRDPLRALSDQAIGRALAAASAQGDRVEALSLQASNEKSLWIEDYRAAVPTERAGRALASPHFETMLRRYLDAVALNLNAHYPAVNALALLEAHQALTQRCPEIWRRRFDSASEAKAERDARRKLATRLAAALSLALEMDKVMGKREGAADPWALSSRADFALISAGDDAGRIGDLYSQALRGADRFTLEASRRNLAVYQDLELFEPGTGAALGVVDAALARTDPVLPPPTRVLLFTGHMVDAPDRPKDKARFPPTAVAEAKARALIEEAVKRELAMHEGRFLGIAGGACGGDILFHEVCRSLDIVTEVYLALPADRFEVASVQRGGPRWIERYRALLAASVEPRVLQETAALPRWLAEKADYDVWQRNNLWMMFSALATDAPDRTLIAMFNAEREPDGPGGTRHLIHEASSRGFKPVVLDATQLLD